MMMIESGKLRSFKSHKIVEAAQIIEVKGLPFGATLVLNRNFGPEEMDPSLNFTQEVDNNFVVRHQPSAGGYLVRYEDGYVSYSPKGAFESGYTPLDWANNLKGGDCEDGEGPG